MVGWIRASLYGLLLAVVPAAAQRSDADGARVLVAGRRFIDQRGGVGQSMRLSVASTGVAAVASKSKVQWRQVERDAFVRGCRYVPAKLVVDEQGDAQFVASEPGLYRFAVSAHQGQATLGTDTVTVVATGELGNADFAAGDGGALPGWRSSPATGGVTAARDPAGGISNSGCLRLSAEQPGHAMVYQDLQLVPYTAYLLRGWMRAEGLTGPATRPAALGLGGEGEGPAAGLRTFGWTPVAVRACTNATGTLQVRCQLGTGDALASGTVWFDQISVVPDPNVRTFEGERFVLHMPAELLALTTQSAVRAMVVKVDAVCASMAELTGNDDEAAVKQSAQYTGAGSGGAGGVSGNPLRWGGYEGAVRQHWASDTYCAEIFLHELGHNFTWGGEWDAEFAMYYALEHTGFSIMEDGYSRGAGSRHRWQARMKHVGDRNGSLLRAIEIRDRIGWEPFRRLYRYMHEHREVHGMGETWARFKLQHDLLSEYSGVDVWAMYTPDELELVRDMWPAGDGTVVGPAPAAVPETERSWLLAKASWQSARVGWEKPQAGAYKGGTVLYRHSLWAHADSDYTYDLGGKWTWLSGLCGVEAGSQGSVCFVVFGDGRELARSGVLRAGDPQPFRINVSGVRALRLVVTDGGDGGTNDHGIWFAPSLSR